jgi:hydroxyacylglutathione hydrolase
MKIEQVYTACLAQASYYVESDGIAAVIDPTRDIDRYLEMAERDNAVIAYVLVTHFHADFVSGHLELANRTGAEIVFGPGATPGYPARIAADGEKLPLGGSSINVLHTPGHTIESACFLLSDEQGQPAALFSGDTLFVGDVGRPDLLSGNLDASELAAQLYDSVHSHLSGLPDQLVLYPGHGPGSACGKNLGKETWSTIGEQRKSNPVFLQSKEAFVRSIIRDQPSAPAYFFKDAAINKNGCADLDVVLKNGLKPLSADEFRQKAAGGATILDTRTVQQPEHRMIPNSLHIGLDGPFAIWAGTFIDFEKPLLITADPGTEKEVVTRLARIGLDTCLGYLDGGLKSWPQEEATAQLSTRTIQEAEDLNASGISCRFLDVRTTAEFERSHLYRAIHIPLDGLREKAQMLNKDHHYAVYCAAGYRSAIAVTLLQQAGFRHVYSISGGIASAVSTVPKMITTC